MANRIKGITIEIDGNTTGLDKALQSINKSIRESQTALKDVDRLLKLNPSSTELLSQKQQYLGEAVAATRSKLIEEMDAMDSLNERAKKGEDVSEQQNALRREIEATKQSLEELTDQYSAFGSVGVQQIAAVGEKVKEVGSKISDVGAGMTKGLTVPIVGIGAASVAAWKEVDAGLDIIVTKTGATGDALEDMQNRAQNIATTIPTSFEAAGTAIGEVNTRFGLTGDELEKLSTKFIEFAEINGTDVNSSIDSVQKVLSAFGLSAAEAGPLLDTLNKVGQDTGVSMDALAATMVSNATAFHGFGLNAADAANLLGVLEKSGIDTSVVMTGMSKVQATAMKDGISMQDAFAKALNSSEEAIEVFGAKAGPKLYASFQQGTISAEMFTASQHSLNDALGSVSDTYQGTLDPLDSMTTVMNEMKTVGADIVNAVGPQLADIFSRVGEVVKGLAEGWKGMSEDQKQMIITVAALIAVLGPLLSIIGTVVSTIGTIMTMAPALSGAIAALSGPIGIAVVAIGAAVAAGIALWQNWDTVKSKASELWSSIKSTFENIKNSITEKINAAKDAVMGAVEKIKGAFNFQWKLPSLKLPHFSITEGKLGLPSISVSWYKKGYTDGVLFNSPTVLPTANGWKGFGDGNGGELVIGLDRLREVLGTTGNSVNVNVYASPGMNETALANKVAAELDHWLGKRL